MHQQLVGLEEHLLSGHKNNINPSELNNIFFNIHVCIWINFTLLWSSPLRIVKAFNYFVNTPSVPLGGCS